MKNFHKGSLVLAASLMATATFAQVNNHPSVQGTVPFSPSSDYRTWSVGFNAGVLNQSNIYGIRREGFDKLKHNVGYSGYIKKQLSPSFGLKAQYLGGKVQGENENAVNGEVSSFETKMPWSAALTAEWTLANINFRLINSFIKPYVAIGAGALNFENSITGTNLGQPVNDQAPNNNLVTSTVESEAKTKLYVPLDLGFKFAIAQGINLDLGYQLNFANQNFNGTGNVSGHRPDLFSYAHAGLEFALGSGQKAVLANSNPVATIVNDYTKKYDQLKSERDALVASNNELKGAVNALSNELKDDDGDGVANKFDKCPGTPSGVQVDGSGCPIVVKHETTVIEKTIVTEEDQKVVNEAIQNLEFDLSKASISPKSHASLNRVAEILVKKNFSLKLAGHTDNTGSLALNNRLSKDRAEAVKAYLVSQGANPSRIEATGYGPNQPIATNSTAAGRQQNRRVEFTLY